MRAPFGYSAYDFNDYNLPVVVLENWYPEVKQGLGQTRLLPTPGLTSFLAASTGIRGLFQADGAISGEIVLADGTQLRRVTSGGVATNIGAAIATDAYRAKFAASYTQLVGTSGGTAYLITASARTAITVTGATSPIISVAEIGQRFIYLERDGGRFRWSDVSDAATVGAGAVAVAEQEPDALLRVEVYRGSVFLFGTKVIELWQQTGAQDAAFVPRPGAVIPVGLIGRDAVVKSDDALFMVATTGQIFRLDDSGREKVSTVDIEKRIKSLSSANQALVSLASWEWKGHEFIRVNLPGQGAWNYDLSTGAWHRQKTLNVETHIATDYVGAFGTTFAAGAGGLYSLSDDVYTENGELVRRVAEGIVPIEDGRPAIERLTIYTSTKGVPLSGQGSEPLGLLQVSRNGVTFENEIPRVMPKAGEYSKGTTWGPLGRVMPPVMKFRFAISDPIGLTLSDAQLNMARP